MGHHEGSLRRVRAWLAVAALCGIAGAAQAATSCQPARTAGMERCVSGLAPAQMLQMQQQQEAPNWCWAATVSMLLGRYGLQVPQAQVAREHLGRADDVRVPVDAFGELLNRTWRDAAGRQVAASSSPMPAWRESLGVAAPEVLQDLDQGRPLLLAAHEHAMVLVQLVYERPIAGQPEADAGVHIVRAVVLDPEAGGLRSLTAAERHPEYLARVAVEAPATTARQPVTTTERVALLRD